ncbi:hypothetical protein BC332_08034 [Capsicum chinense]|nr:hypothetical protein BC332_08034 [Capsicum chinense]
MMYNKSRKLGPKAIAVKLADSVFKLVVIVFEVGIEFLISYELDQEHYLQCCGIKEGLQNTFFRSLKGYTEDVESVATDVEFVAIHIESITIDLESVTTDLESVTTDLESVTTDLKSVTTDLEYIKPALLVFDLFQQLLRLLQHQ